jgi:hypothetical protein
VLWGRIPRGNGGRVAAVLLVDNAAQPMQAAPVAALMGIAVSGNASKLHVIFTQFDQIKGNNLPGFSDREQHVLASLENVLKSIGDELGPAAERVLRRRIDQARFFVGGIQDPLDAKKKAGSCSIQQLDAAPEPLGGPRTRRRCRPEPSRVQPHEPVAGPDGGSQEVPHPLARHPRSGLQPGRA